MDNWNFFNPLDLVDNIDDLFFNTSNFFIFGLNHNFLPLHNLHFLFDNWNLMNAVDLLNDYSLFNLRNYFFNDLWYSLDMSNFFVDDNWNFFFEGDRDGNFHGMDYYSIDFHHFRIFNM